jgi:methylenetetrahydrofolate dehydrogenase (NADP+) / methenyltetrahydrofolate cyclohydrolase
LYTTLVSTILSGLEPAQAILLSLKDAISKKQPVLRIVQVGNDDASTTYITKKIQTAHSIGIQTEHCHFAESIEYEEILALIVETNTNPDITGLIIQVPLPKHLEEKLPLLIRALDPKKDVDGFGAYNLGKMFLSTQFEHLPPATPAGVIALLEYYNIPIEGQNIVVIGHSNVVGKPLATMLLNRNATVLCTHKYTKDISEFTKNADIVCTAVGKPNLLSKAMVSSKCTVIDIGFNRINGKVCGDAVYEDLYGYVKAITPTPGGIGPMTVAALLRNVVTAQQRQLTV